MDEALIRSFLRETVVLRTPFHKLSTFGASHIPYHVISPVKGDTNKTRLREGTVRSERPKILTAETLKERFSGFGEESREFSRWLSSKYQDVLKALEYNFNNQAGETELVSENALEVAERIQADLDRREIKDRAVIRCPEDAWSLALMKLTLDEAERSFPTNVRDLDRRGLFDPDGKEDTRRRREIEKLFTAVKGGGQDSLKLLGVRLRDYGLFDEYEDRYLSFF